MAEKGFGVKEVNLIGASGTPTITSPNNLNLNAVNVAISTNASIGGNLTVSGTVGIAGTLTYEDVTNIDSVGIVTARSGIDCNGDIDVDGHTNLDNVSVAGVSTFSGSINATGGLVGNATKITLTSSTSNSSLPVLFSTGVIGSSGADTLINSSKLTFNPSSGTLTASSFSGSGVNLTGIAVTEAPVTDYTITGDGSHYYFHGGGVDETAGDPDLYLIRGQKYRFNNTTGSDHPFEFRIASGGSAYSNGVSGDDEGVQFFTVPYDAPARIFYQCTIHGGMVGNIYIRGAGGQNDNIGVSTFTGNADFSAGVDVTSGDLNIGSSVGRFDSSGLIKTAHGSESAPSHTFINDPDNGMYRPTTNTLGFVTGGTERLRIDSSGLINVKTRSAGVRRMILSGSPSNSAFNIESHDGATGTSADTNQGELGLYYNDGSTLTDEAVIKFYRGSGAGDGYFGFNTGSTERLRIDSSGDVEIMQAKNLIWVYEGGSTHRARIRALSNDELIFENGSGNSERLRITGDGVFHLNSSDSASGGRIYANSSSLYLQSGNGRQTIRVSDAAAGVNRTIEMTSAGNLKFPAGATIGIDFSAKSNLSGETKTTLTHYEEGTWTPSFANLNNASHVTIDYATYTRVGRIVTISVKFTVSSSINDASGFGFTLPYGPISDRQIVIPAISDRSGSNKDPFAFNNVNSDHTLYVKTLDGYAFQSYNTFSGNYIVATGSYETDA